MSEIAKCPICGNCIKVQRPDPSYYDLKTYHCCGHAVYADTPEKWNQYAAAMELAKAEVNQNKAIQLSAHGYIRTDYVANVGRARQRVLEVFGK